jgi:hypothetical protein
VPLFGEAKREYQRVWIAARRAAWFADKRCVVCGTTENLELHHIDPETKVANSVWSWTQERRDAELAKCEVRCESCHKPETIAYLKEIKITPLSEKKHGTYNTYGRFGCRCEPCKAWRHGQYVASCV